MRTKFLVNRWDGIQTMYLQKTWKVTKGMRMITCLKT